MAPDDVFTLTQRVPVVGSFSVLIATMGTSESLENRYIDDGDRVIGWTGEVSFAATTAYVGHEI
jgi:hypothetical protein